MNKIVEALRATPSRSKRTLLDTAASEIERLTDRCARYAEEIAVLQERTRWVPVEERLPRPGERVLATEGTLSAEAYMTTAHTWRRNYGVLWCDVYGRERTVTHWMPLPEPPEVEESEDGDGVYLNQ